MKALEGWLARPRRPFWDAVPTVRLFQALIAVPYIFTGFLIADLVGSEDPATNDVVLLSVFSIAAAVETAFLVLWLRRPLATSQSQSHSGLWVFSGVAVGVTLLATSALLAR